MLNKQNVTLFAKLSGRGLGRIWGVDSKK